MERALESLSEPVRRFLEPLRAIHSASSAYDPKTTGDAKYRGETAIQYTYSERIYDEVVHPVVRTHPVTGRKSLYVNPMFTQQIVGLSKPESAALLAMLHDLSTRPELTCRIHWENGTVAIWDNRWLQHYAIDDYADYERVMYRVTIRGRTARLRSGLRGRAEPRNPRPARSDAFGDARRRRRSYTPSAAIAIWVTPASRAASMTVTSRLFWEFLSAWTTIEPWGFSPCRRSMWAWSELASTARRSIQI